jgi:hypothetical protein
MMRDVWIKLNLTEEEAAHFEGRTAMVVALNDEELVNLRSNIIGISDFLGFTLKGLRTLKQVHENATTTKDKQIAKTLDMLLEPADVAVELHNNTRKLLGRAVFVGPDRKEVLQ